MQIQSYAIRRVCHPYYEQRKSAYPDCEAARSGWHPYVHQAVLLDEWSKHNAFLLTTKRAVARLRLRLCLSSPMKNRHSSSIPLMLS